jgi:opacity protein-like surface antigen
MTTLAFRGALLVCSMQAGSAFFCASAAAQNTSELGLGLGATNYKGEVSPQYQLQNNRPAFTVFYRKDVSVPITLRGAFTAGLLRADDGNVAGETGTPSPLQAFRQTNTRGSILEASAVVEYNFLDYRYRNDKLHFTPYLFLGIAGYYANTSTVSNNTSLGSEYSRSGSMFGISVPAGVGFKYALSKRINLGLEVGVRKTFTDELDHLGDQSPVLVNSHDQDWYYYNGLSLSYTFYKIRCPDQYKKNKKLLK